MLSQLPSVIDEKDESWLCASSLLELFALVAAVLSSDATQDGNLRSAVAWSRSGRFPSRTSGEALSKSWSGSHER